MKLVKLQEVYRINVFFEGDKAAVFEILDPKKDMKVEEGLLHISVRDGSEVIINSDKVCYTQSRKFKEAVDEETPAKVGPVAGDDPENLI